MYPTFSVLSGEFLHGREEQFQLTAGLPRRESKVNVLFYYNSLDTNALTESWTLRNWPESNWDSFWNNDQWDLFLPIMYRRMDSCLLHGELVLNSSLPQPIWTMPLHFWVLKMSSFPSQEMTEFLFWCVYSAW